MQGNTYKAEIVKQATDLFCAKHVTEGSKIKDFSAFTSQLTYTNEGQSIVFVRATIEVGEGFEKEITEQYQF